MEATRTNGAVRAGPAAREQFYDARGYGRPSDGDIVLAPVEAAHLLFRGDLDGVDGLGFHDFLASSAVSAVEFQVYKDLRDRGFYLSPVRDPAAAEAAGVAPGDVGVDGADLLDFVVYPRGKGPWDDAVAYRVRAVSERAAVPAGELVALAAGQGEAAAAEGVLAVVDEESELTYLGWSRQRPTGETTHDLPAGVPATLLSDRVLVPDPPGVLHDRAFYGQRLDREDGDLQLSLVEAAALAGQGVLAVEGGEAALRERGRQVEGDRFDRRLRVYRALRESGVVPKTGFKFGADFRTYADVATVADLGHSELLVRVLPGDHVFDPRDVALDVRLAHGVRKRMVFALVNESGATTGAEEAPGTTDADEAAGTTGADRAAGGTDGEGIDWLAVERLTP